MGLHIAHWKIAGRTLAPLEVNEVLHTVHLGIITAGFIFMAVAVLATSVVGRFFCSWGCHLLALEDLCAWLLRKVGVHPKPIRSRVLLWVPTMAMAYLIVWPQVQRLLRGEALPTLRIVAGPEGWTSFVTTDLWRNLPGPWIAALTFAVCGFAIVYFLGSRSFCSYACPYGAIFGGVDRLAPGRIVGTGDCKQCGRCTAACQSHVRVREEIEHFGAVVSSSCLKDLDCVSACPNNALRFGFSRPPLISSWAALRGDKGRYSFSLPEDALMGAVFLTAVVIFRGLYDAVPFLMALGIAVIFAYGAVLCVRLAREAHVGFNHFQLKAAGRLTGAGVAFTAAAVLLGVFTLHSGFIRYHSYRGQQAFNQLAVPVPGSADRGSSTIAESLAATALSRFQAAYRWGLVRPRSLRRRLASLYELTGSPAAAEAQLRVVLAEEPDDREARLRLGRLLLGLERADEAADELRAVVSAPERPYSRDTILRGAAHIALAQIAERSGRGDDAIRHRRQAVQENPEDPGALLSLGELLTDAGRLDEAATYLLRSIGLRPGSAAAHNNLGVVLARLDRVEEAIRHYRVSLGIEPGDARVHYNLGLLLHKKGQLHAAEESFLAALALDPDDARARASLALALREGGDIEHASRRR